ncbi:hypothetical protein EDD16DRAFT_1541006 [Pisolithus croceorrhizus]|nr:hypothetical protein EV401DRAFT_156543 [Pisolithus croceorrhizus]KAI6130788.1 hypothetical protein EDD16DRAFT_1541006 [Pisolithus croceorrhizus]
MSSSLFPNLHPALCAFFISLNTVCASAEALAAVCASSSGQVPDDAFACAGASLPIYLISMTAEGFEQDMTGGGWVQVWTAFAATKDRTRRERLFWFHYAGIHVFRELLFLRIYKTPSLRSWAISLMGVTLIRHRRPYLLPSHYVYPGFDEVNKTKPSIIHNRVCSVATITANLITSLLCALARGSAPKSNAFVDTVLDLVAWIGEPIWK